LKNVIQYETNVSWKLGYFSKMFLYIMYQRGMIFED